MREPYPYIVKPYSHTFTSEEIPELVTTIIYGGPSFASVNAEWADYSFDYLDGIARSAKKWRRFSDEFNRHFQEGLQQYGESIGIDGFAVKLWRFYGSDLAPKSFLTAIWYGDEQKWVRQEEE